MPQRRDLDPVDIPRLLPHIGLIEVHQDPMRFRYRLVGTNMVNYFGRDHTGRWLHEAKSGTYMRFLHDLYKQCVTDAVPTLSIGVFVLRGVERRDNVKRLILPMRNGSDDVSLLLFANDFTNSTIRFETVGQDRASRIETFLESYRAPIDAPPGYFEDWAIATRRPRSTNG